jgi:hypothetical protein
MATAPQIALRNGLGYTTSLVFSTNESAIVITGTVTVDTVALQISVNGSAFSSDPTLILFDQQTFTIPNPNSYPSGLALALGVNTIAIRAIDILGAVSATSTATVTYVLTVNDVSTLIPTGVRVVRANGSVNIQAIQPNLVSNTATITNPSSLVSNPATLVVPPSTTFQGFNFYASTTPGGATGYFLVNQSPVTTPTVYEEDDVSSAQDIATWDNTTLKNIRIQVTETDNFGNLLNVRFDKSYPAGALGPKLRYSSNLQSYQFNNFISFTHTRSGGTGIINSDQFANVSNSDPLYYVVTAVFFDSVLNQEVETPYSQEVLGTPLTIDTAILDLPGRTAAQITTDYITAIQRVNASVALIPGSTSRDVSIDPFASEAERLWFLLDFIHRSQSFLTLIQIDDTTGNGMPDAVASSPYKSALKAAIGATTDDQTQSLIDTQYDKLAANVDKTRLPGAPAVGQVVIYTPTRPLLDIVIPAGTIVTASADSSQNLPAWPFLIAGSYTLPAENSQAYYNFSTQRYEIVADIVATQAGADGNRSAGTITSISGVAGVSVVNESSTVFGTDVETNEDLAARAMLGFQAVDTGTQGGYALTAASQIGIIKALVVKSGDPLMMRDYDPVRHKHIGGKVDIWVQGVNERNITETFAFTYQLALNIPVEIINISTLVFQVLDSRVTPSTPITEILSGPGQGVFNVTQGIAYDLTGATILSYNTFQLNAALPDQPTTHIDDVIEVDYRFQSVNTFTFSYQPVRRIVSVVGEIAGPLDLTHNIIFDQSDDPLITGQSTIATDNLTLVQYNGIPSGSPIQVNNETHVIIGFFQVPLSNVGINTDTIAVYSADRTIEYNGPSSPTPDYDIIQGTPTTPALIIRTATSTIVSGQTVSVDYTHDENFTVTYVINDLLQQLQEVVNTKRHVTADVLVKQAIDNNVNIETTVQLKAGASQSTVDAEIRSAVSIVLNTKLIGQGVAQSNVDGAINDQSGVSFNVLPFATMGYADGSIKLREAVNSAFESVASLDIGGNNAFILTAALENPTTDNGGLPTQTHGVFQDDVQLTNAASLAQVCLAANQGWIIGSEGASILGYSDDATLIAQGFTTPAAILAQRLLLTANHVVVSLSNAGSPADVPTNHVYTVTYIVSGQTGAHDITAAQVEYITLGNFNITYASA